MGRRCRIGCKKWGRAFLKIDMFFAKRVVIASLGQKLFVISLDQQIFYSLKRSFKHMGFYGDFQGELQLFRYIRYFVINRFAITRFKCTIDYREAAGASTPGDPCHFGFG